MNISILHSRGMPQTMVCRILLFMWSFGPLASGPHGDLRVCVEKPSSYGKCAPNRQSVAASGQAGSLVVAGFLGRFFGLEVLGSRLEQETLCLWASLRSQKKDVKPILWELTHAW